MTRNIILIALAAAAGAQTPAGLGTGFAQKIKQNEEALQRYSFRRRTEIQIKNYTRTREELVRFVDGKRQTVPLDGSKQSPAEEPQGMGGIPGRGGILRGAIVRQKKQEMKETVEQLRNLMRRYASLESLGSASQKGSISRTGEGINARVVLSARGVVQPADSVTLTWNVPAHRPEKIEIATQLDGKPATATVDYAELPNGPFYAARTHVSVPKRNIELAIETYDYTPGSDAR